MKKKTAAKKSAAKVVPAKRPAQREESAFQRTAQQQPSGNERRQMKLFAFDDDVTLEEIVEEGEPHQAPAAVSYLLKVDEPFQVRTEAGELQGEPGDSVGFEEKLSRLFLVKPDEAKLYEPVEVGADGHKHDYQAGVLPGNKRIKTCKVCGTWREIDRAEWETLKQQNAPARFAAPGRNYA